MEFICAGADPQRTMLTDLIHPSHLVLVNLLIVLAELGGAMIVAAVVLAFRRLFVLAAAPRPRAAPALLARQRR